MHLACLKEIEVLGFHKCNILQPYFMNEKVRVMPVTRKAHILVKSCEFLVYWRQARNLGLGECLEQMTQVTR